ncbi:MULTISPECIES: hypothetical protein [Methylotuvimicrobium]|uniref:Uncharacterized protein n=2 Tax=Methylotuvimicrobium TaxID=2822410 RepID=G4STR0_META2|nr:MULTISPECIES: hypothetical protein [Methylotuvimicrobium]QCW80838.1 hypothetical protein EQU24_00130 [Methylotuvimicrobium buryatense]CCE21732.1 exported protein of unknown function [Methylotuvimicrobium alcaliphilum 20Z]
MKLTWRGAWIILAGSLLILANGSAQTNQLAGITFNESESPTIKPKAMTKPELKTKKDQWHELHGSLNNRYVFLIVKKTGARDVTGYLFDGKGNKKYIYGEWFNRNLQVYDQSNKLLNIILYP